MPKTQNPKDKQKIDQILLAKNIEKNIKNNDIFEKKTHRCLWQIAKLEINLSGLYLIAGRNGCGKSTLLRSLLGLVKLETGTVRWLDKTLCSADELGYLPEFPIIPPAAKARQWLSWMLDISDKNLDSMQLNTYKALSINEILDIPANRLSKGQQQRVQLWAALARNPQIIVMDEPFSGLDPWAKAELSDLIIQLLAEGKTILMATHELSDKLKNNTAQTWILANTRVNIDQGCTLPS